MYLQVVIIGFATLIMVVGAFLNGLIIYYLKSKDDLHKTGFDKVLIDSIWSMILFGVMVYLGLVLIIITPEVSQEFLLLFNVIKGIILLNMATSTFMTIVTKLCYLKESDFMFGTSDNKIYGVSIITRMLLITIIACLNYLKPFAGVPIEYVILLDKPYEYPNPPFPGPGLGTIVLGISWTFLAIYTENLSRKIANQPASNVAIMKLLRSFGIFIFLFAVIYSILNSPNILDNESDQPKILASCSATFVSILFNILVPILVIYRNENLKTFVATTIETMIPIVYIPSFVPSFPVSNQVYNIDV